MAVFVENKECQHNFISCRWSYKIFTKCGCCKYKYRFWHNFLKCETCNLKCHAKCVGKIDKVRESKTCAETMGDQHKPEDHAILKPTSEVQITVYEQGEHCANLDTELTQMTCEFDIPVEREHLSKELVLEEIESVPLKMSAQRDCSSETLDHLVPEFDPPEKTAKCELMNGTINQVAIKFTKNPFIICDNKNNGRLLILQGYSDIMKEFYGIKELRTSTLFSAIAINHIEMVGSYCKPDMHAISGSTSEIQIKMHEQNEKSDEKFSLRTCKFLCLENSVERERPGVNPMCEFKLEASEIVPFKIPAKCVNLGETFNRVAPEFVSSEKAVKRERTDKTDRMATDLMKDDPCIVRIDKVNGWLSSLPGFTETSTESYETVEPRTSVFFPNGKDPMFVERVNAESVCEKKNLRIRFENADLLSTNVSAKRERSNIRLDQAGTELLQYEGNRRCSTVVMSECSIANITAILDDIFENAKNLTPNPAFLSLLKNLNKLFDVFIIDNTTMSKWSDCAHDNMTVQQHTALPRFCPKDVSDIFSKIFETTNELIPHPALPSLMVNLYELVDVVNSVEKDHSDMKQMLEPSPEKSELVQFKMSDQCGCSNETFNQAATESSSTSDFTKPISTVYDVVDLLDDLLKEANERRPHLALPGFQRSLNQCLETAMFIIDLDSATPVTSKCVSNKNVCSDTKNNSLKDDEERWTSVQLKCLVGHMKKNLMDLMDKANMLFTQTYLANVMDDLYKCVDVINLMVPNENTEVHECSPDEMVSESDHSKTELDTQEPNLLWVDQAVSTLLEERPLTTDVTVIFNNIFEKAEILTPDPAFCSLVESLNELLDALNSNDILTSKRPDPKNITGKQHTVPPKIFANDIQVIFSNIFEKAEKLNPHPILPSLMENLYELVDAVGLLIAEKDEDLCRDQH